MDPYSLCPCGSGKKLKFCCSDLIGEIEKIQRMIEGDQPRAALRYVEQTLEKSPGRASLLDLQAMLQLLLGETEAAEKTIQNFLKIDPGSPSAHAHHAMLLSEQEDAVGAIDALQKSLSLVETNLPQRVLEAIGTVGHALMKAGDIVAARAHLWLYESVAGETDDHRALELLVTMNQVAGIPLLLRDRMALRSLPDDHPAASQMQSIQQLAAMGKWQEAATMLDDILPDYLSEPLFFYNRALLSGYLGDRKNFAAGLRLYARQAIPMDDAIEAEAIAQLVDTELKDDLPTAMRLIYDLEDEDAFVERVSSHKQALPLPLSRDELESFEGPKPRTYWMLLDRPEPSDSQEITRDDIPRVLGFVSHYGRQTDRNERLELVTDRDQSFDRTVELFNEIVGDAIGEKTDELDLGPAARQGDPSLTWRWHMPRSLSVKKREELLLEERRAALLERWPDAPRAVLGGKTPREASKVDELQLPLLAAILVLEIGSPDRQQDAVFAELKEHLGLPRPEIPGAADMDPNEFSIARLHRMDLSALSTYDLFLLYQRCVLVNAHRAIQGVIRQALQREEFAQYVPFQKLYEQLFSTENDFEAAVGVLDEARRWSEQQGQSCGRWDLLELQLHIQANNSEDANRVLGHLRDHHMNEPEIAEQIYQLLYMIGAIPNDKMGGPTEPMPAATSAAPAPESSSSIWTPGSDDPTESKSKLWTPD